MTAQKVEAALVIAICAALFFAPLYMLSRRQQIEMLTSTAYFGGSTTMIGYISDGKGHPGNKVAFPVNLNPNVHWAFCTDGNSVWPSRNGACLVSDAPKQPR